jgi:hypothetical protein
VKCEHSSAGKKLGTGGAKIGNVHLILSKERVFEMDRFLAGTR